MLEHSTIKFRMAGIEDAKLIYDWANDVEVREASFYSEPIKWETHLNWLTKKLNDKNSLFLVFYQESKPVGLVRIEDSGEAIIGITIDYRFRGKKLAPILLNKACSVFWGKSDQSILAFIKKTNLASVKSFEKAGFKFYRNDTVNGNACSVYIKTKK